jgi:hypothetical protein
MENKLIIDSCYGGNTYITIGKTYSVSDEEIGFLKGCHDNIVVYVLMPRDGWGPFGAPNLDIISPMCKKFVDMGFIEHKVLSEWSYANPLTPLGLEFLERTKLDL